MQSVLSGINGLRRRSAGLTRHQHDLYLHIPSDNRWHTDGSATNADGRAEKSAVTCLCTFGRMPRNKVGGRGVGKWNGLNEGLGLMHS